MKREQKAALFLIPAAMLLINHHFLHDEVVMVLGAACALGFITWYAAEEISERIEKRKQEKNFRPKESES